MFSSISQKCPNVIPETSISNLHPVRSRHGGEDLVSTKLCAGFQAHRIPVGTRRYTFLRPHCVNRRT